MCVTSSKSSCKWIAEQGQRGMVSCYNLLRTTKRQEALENDDGLGTYEMKIRNSYVKVPVLNVLRFYLSVFLSN